MADTAVDAIRQRMAERKQRVQASNARASQAYKQARGAADQYLAFTLRREATIELLKQHGLVGQWGEVSELEKSLARLKAQCPALQGFFFDRRDHDTPSKQSDQGHTRQRLASSDTAPRTPPSSSPPSVKKAAGARGAPPPPPPLPPPLPGSSQASGQQARAAAGPPAALPPPPPPLPPAAGGLAASGPRPAPPPPPPPLPGSLRPAAAAAGGGRGTRAPPPPPPPLPGATAGAGSRAAAAPAAGGGKAAQRAGGITALAAEAAAAAAARAPQQQQQQSEQQAGGSSGPGTPRSAAAAAAGDDAGGNGSPRQPPLLGDAGGGGKLKTLHVDPVPVHKLAEGSFWRVAHPVAKGPVAGSMEYLLRAMFSDRPRATGRRATEHSPRSSSASGGGADPDSSAAAGGGGGPEAPPPRPLVTCVPEKRALQVEVVLKRLRMRPGLLAAAINQLNTDKLKADDLASLRSILPKQEEVAQVRQAKQAAEKTLAAAAAAGCGSPVPPAGGEPAAANGGLSPLLSGGVSPVPRLGVVEACFDALGAVELLPAKMRAMEFRYDLDSTAALVADYAADLGRSLEALRVSGSLHYLLAFVRDVANTMNSKGPRGGLEGFKLESLARLQSTKMAGATDLNLLHYIVAHLSAVLPGALLLDDERQAFRAACRRGTFDAVSARIRTLQETHKRLTADLAKAQELQRQRTTQQQQDDGAAAEPPSPSSGPSSHDVYVSRLAQLLEAAAPRIARVQAQLDAAIRTFRWTAEYYCEEVDRQAWKQQPVAFLQHFLNLLDGLAATQRDAPRLARVTAMLSDFMASQQQAQHSTGEGAAAQLEGGEQIFLGPGEEEEEAALLDDIGLTEESEDSDSAIGAAAAAGGGDAAVAAELQRQQQLLRASLAGVEGAQLAQHGSGELSPPADEEQLRSVAEQLLRGGQRSQMQQQRSAQKPHVPRLPLGGARQQQQQQRRQEVGAHSVWGSAAAADEDAEAGSMRSSSGSEPVKKQQQRSGGAAGAGRSVTPRRQQAAAPNAAPAAASPRCEGVGCSRHRRSSDASSPGSGTASPGTAAAADCTARRAAAGAAAAPSQHMQLPRWWGGAGQEHLSRSFDSSCSGLAAKAVAAAMTDSLASSSALSSDSAACEGGRRVGSRRQAAVAAAGTRQQQQQPWSPAGSCSSAAASAARSFHHQQQQQRARSVSPLRPGCFPSPGRPSPQQQQRLEALRLRTRQSPKQQWQAELQQRGWEQAGDDDDAASPLPALLPNLVSVGKTDRGPEQQQQQQQQQREGLSPGGTDAGGSPAADNTLARLLFGEDSFDLSASREDWCEG